MGSSHIAVEIVRAGPGGDTAIHLQLPPDATVGDALHAASVALGIDDIEALADLVGIFGQRCDLRRLVQDGDRIEIYRPLLLDPKAARRLRAARAVKRAR